MSSPQFSVTSDCTEGQRVRTIRGLHSPQSSTRREAGEWPRQTWLERREGGRWEESDLLDRPRGQHGSLCQRWWAMEVEVPERFIKTSSRVRWEWESEDFEYLPGEESRAMCRKLEDCLLTRTGFRVFVVTAFLVVLVVIGLYRWVTSSWGGVCLRWFDGEL